MRGDPKTDHVNVRMSPKERAAIVARSRSFGMAPSTYMREAALLRDTKPVTVADTEQLTALRSELKRIGTNLNQAVRALHAYGPNSTTLRNLETSLDAVSEAASHITQLLLRAAQRE